MDDGWMEDGWMVAWVELELQSSLEKLLLSPKVQEEPLGFPNFSNRSLDGAGSNPNPVLSTD